MLLGDFPPTLTCLGDCKRENRVAGRVYLPVWGMERLHGAVWEGQTSPRAIALPSKARPLWSICVVLSLVSDAGRSASCWSRKSQWALEWKPPPSPMCQAAGPAPSPRCSQSPWFSLCWKAKAAVVQSHQGPRSHRREEAEEHCWTGEGREGELWPWVFRDPLFPLPASWVIQQNSKEVDFVTLCNLVSSFLSPWHLPRGPLKPRGQFTGLGGLWMTCVKAPVEQELSEHAHQPREQEEAFCSEGHLPQVCVKAGAQTSISVCWLAGHWAPWHPQ